MKIKLYATALVVLLPLLARAQEDPVKPKAAGMWQAPDKSGYLELNSNGSVIGYGLNMTALGKWSKSADSEDILFDFHLYGAKLDDRFQAILQDADTLRLSINGQAQDFTRLKSETANEKFVGNWLNSEKEAKVDGLTHHTVLTRTPDGKGVYKCISISETHKNYCVYEEVPFRWRTVAGGLVETCRVSVTSDYDEQKTHQDEHDLFIVSKIAPEKMSLVPARQIGTTIDYTKIPEAKLPEPPKGFKQATSEEFWEFYSDLEPDVETEEITEVEQ